ncbi:hypothetical protein NHX12_010035 [Muraenolepis orangiensis]|uniref:Arf-GAP with Rho-GAP domain, ANK repeat and PH domain-containing protein 1-like n=1 Tax=Muraenolepis orangiensis TaxID=630683 RepID=A0A9Q0DKH3_9TELE|nr:hypothetical protein NHX12_010035 [Muraenolepis orangiensis]
MAAALGPSSQVDSAPNQTESSEELQDEDFTPPPDELAGGRSQDEPETESSNEDEGPEEEQRDKQQLNNIHIEQDDATLQKGLSNQTSDGLPGGGNRPDPDGGYPGVGFPGVGYTGGGYPGVGFPGVGYTGGGYTGGGYTGGGYPGGGYPGVGYPGGGYPGGGHSDGSLASVTDMIASTIPSLSGVASYISTPFPAPIGQHSKTSTVASHIPSLTGDAYTMANPVSSAGPATSSTPNLESITSSLATHIPALAGLLGYSPADTMTTSSAPLDHKDQPVTDTTDFTPPPDELAGGRSQDEPETESSNEDEGPEEEQRDKQQLNNIHIPIKEHKTPRAATIRVSRKKKKEQNVKQNSEVRVASWLDVWKGFRHSVDKSSEVMFHVSSITRVKQQEKGRFSIYFGKKHYDFMAHNDAVQGGWISSLQSSRGQASPAPPQHHGPITIKDPRHRVYAAVMDQELWVYHNKEDYQVGVAWFTVPLNVATVKPTGKRSFSLITPYRKFSIAVDSTAELSVWQTCLSKSILSALSSSQVALQLWENPSNKVCGDCGAASPEWASVNLLLLLCQACAGQHRALGTSLSKVRSLTLDSKIWGEPLIQLFICYGNRVANQIWSPAVPAAEHLLPTASDEERSEYIRNKYAKARYRKPHPLASSPALLYQETLTLLCSGAKLSCQSEPQSQSPLSLAERAGQTLQRFHLPSPCQPIRALRSPVQNDSAACDVLDLREVCTVLRRSSLEFEIVHLGNRLICASDNQLDLHTHLLHVLQVILPAEINSHENSINLLTGKRNVNLRFEDEYSFQAWVELLKDVIANLGTAPQLPAANQNTARNQLKLEGTVPVAVERCLQVDGIYRRCGLASKVSKLVEALQSHPGSAPMDDDEQGILDVGSALKQYIRQQPPLFPPKHRDLWIKAAAQSEELARLASYRRLLRQLPGDNRATLNALIGHFYVIQMFSSQNQMTAQNLALVLVPTLFQDHHRDLVRLTRDLIIHHFLMFLTPEQEEEEEQITVF